VIGYNLGDNLSATIRNWESPDTRLSAFIGPLNYAHDWLFVILPFDVTARIEATADIGFVEFDLTAEDAAFVAHGFADAMADIPSRLVTDFQVPLKLEGAHALLGICEQRDGDEPLHQRQMGIVEKRLGLGRELVAALLALIQVTGWDCAPVLPGALFGTKFGDLVGPADCPFGGLADATDAFRPTSVFEVIQAFFLGSVLSCDPYQVHA
jgi:hypothetical protein